MNKSKHQNHYFKHDFSAFNDTKIQNLYYRHGYKGYGIFWHLLEQLASNNGTIDYDIKKLAFMMREDEELINSVITDFDLFSLNEKFISNIRLTMQLEEIRSKSEKAKHSQSFRKYDKKPKTLPKRKMTL